VVPGVPLPAKGIVWILDVSEDRPELVHIDLDTANLNRHVGKNIARNQFFLKAVATLELPDATAKQRVTSRTPVIFVRKTLEEEELQSAAKDVQAHYVLLRMHAVDGRRVLYGFSASPFFGKFTRQKEDEVEVLSEEVAAGQWMKLTPKQPLADGEYAVNRMPDDKALFENFAYAFGIGTPATQAPAPVSSPLGPQRMSQE
jgi:hypothetical protein